MGGQEDDKIHFTNIKTPYEKHLEKYLKYKSKYLSLKNQSGGDLHNWQDEKNWTNKGIINV